MRPETLRAEDQIDREAGFVESFRPLLTHREFSHAATDFLTRLAQSLGCERASLGFVSGKSIKVCAVSQYYQGIKDATLPEVSSAMEESVLQDAALVYPQSSSDFPHIVIAHSELVRSNGLACALTVPLGEDGKLIGAITLESRRTNAFDAARLEAIQQLALNAGPLLRLKWSLDQPLRVRLAAALRTQVMGDGGVASRGLRIALLVAVSTCVGVLAFLPLPHKVSGQAHLDASIQRVITAPIDGYLKEVRVRPGDRVQAQEAMAELNDDSLLAENRRLEAEAAQQENALAEAMVKADRTQVAIRRAKLDEVIAQKDLIEQQLGRVQLVSPFDGVVIKGDLTQLLGSPLKRGDVLLTISEGPEFRVIVEVPERDIGDIKVGQGGVLVLTAMPQNHFAIHVTRITPVASVSSDGQNIFEIEAALDGNAAKLVPGLKGVAKIETDKRPLGAEWLSRLWHSLSFLVWSKLG